MVINSKEHTNKLKMMPPVKRYMIRMVLNLMENIEILTMIVLEKNYLIKMA